MMPLTLADNGEEYVVKRMGGSAEVKKHLEDLGFVVGTAVSVPRKGGERSPERLRPFPGGLAANGTGGG